MKLQNINCDYLKITANSYSENYLNSTLSSIEINGSINDSNIIKKTINLSVINGDWIATITFNSNTRLTQIYLKNIITNISIGLLPDNSSFEITSQGIIDISNAVRETLDTELLLTNVEQSYQLIDTTTLQITLSNLPVNLFPNTTRIKDNITNAEVINYFQTISDEDIIFNGTSILLKPSFFELTDFIDGIYKITINTLDTQNVLYRETSCYFMDCKISGSLINTIELDECNEADIRTLMIHYSLRIASNNNCDCDKMQSAFNFLNKNIDTSNTDPCGC